MSQDVKAIGALGTSGVSLALGAYNMTQIFSMQDSISQLNASERARKRSNVEVVDDEEIEVVPETVFGDSDLEGIIELQTKVTELERLNKKVTDKSSANTDLINQKSDTVAQLDNFVVETLDEMNDMQTIVEDNVNGLKISVDSLMIEIADIKTNAIAVNRRIDDVEEEPVVAAIATGTTTAETVAAALVLTNKKVTTINNNWDEMVLVAKEKNGRFDVENLFGRQCKIGLKYNSTNESYISFNSFNSAAWSMYMASGVGKGPDTKALVTHGNLSGAAIRMRLGKQATDGFVVENDSGTGIASISSTGVAGFNQLNVVNPTGTNTTHFNHGNTGENFIRMAKGKSTKFSWGTGSTKLAISENEISMNGIDLLATIKALQADVAALKATALVDGQRVHLESTIDSPTGDWIRRSDTGGVDISGREASGRTRFYLKKA